jgi:hypothetical protein
MEPWTTVALFLGICGLLCGIFVYLAIRKSLVTWLVEKMMDKLFNTMIDTAPKLIEKFFSAEAVQRITAEMLPKMIEASFGNMSEEDKRKMMDDAMPSPEDIEKQVMAVLPKLVQEQMGSMGGMGMPAAAKPPMPNQPKDAPPTSQPKDAPPTSQKKKGMGMGRWTMGT